MRIIADFHIHSKYSRATSKDMDVESLAKWADIKGIDLLGTGDFTHPAYFNSLKSKLESEENGFFRLKEKNTKAKFILTAEVSNIFSQGNKKGRRIHNLIFAPSFEAVTKINSKLEKRGKLSSDGRPIFGFPAKELVKMIMDISDECMIIPAHAWTPWFSVFGANSGFDSIEECFEEESKYIYAIETGLSSDPAMNWRVSALDRISLISNSDAHSPKKLGRESNVFDCEFNYMEIIKVLKEKDIKKFLYTIEFFPEEGKYHYDGHRDCKVLLTPDETKKYNYICPNCNGKITVGVMHRVEVLADRNDGFVPERSIPYKNLIPLQEIISECLGMGVASAGVVNEYKRIVGLGGTEFKVLLDLEEDDLKKIASAKIVEGIMKVREGKVSIIPGYDGEYGKVKIFEDGKKEKKKGEEQINLF